MHENCSKLCLSILTSVSHYPVLQNVSFLLEVEGTFSFRKMKIKMADRKKHVLSKVAIRGKGYMHGRRAANVHLAIRTANCRGRYCCRVNSPEKAHSYLHGRRAVNHAFYYLHGGCRAGKSCIWLFARQIKFAAPSKRYTL